MSIPKLLAVFLLLCLFLTACTATADNRLGGLRRCRVFPGSFLLPIPLYPPPYIVA